MRFYCSHLALKWPLVLLFKRPSSEDFRDVLPTFLQLSIEITEHSTLSISLCLPVGISAGLYGEGVAMKEQMGCCVIQSFWAYLIYL